MDNDLRELDPVMPAEDHAPLFVLCAARSGSTLLRLMLDSHPDLSCPPETNIAAVFAAIDSAINATLPPVEAVELSRTLCRHVGDAVMSRHARDAGKRAWADKSLLSVVHAELLLAVYPNARFVCLYRDCRDTIASLREACAWGFNNFGVEPYVREYASNLVVAFAAYWADRVSLLQQFEVAHPSSCLRIKYEDLVAQPESSLGNIFSFGDLRADQSAVLSASTFARANANALPGDIKVRFTSGVHTRSVGRGWAVPTEMLPPPLRNRINELSSELGYLPIADPADQTAPGQRYELSLEEDSPAARSLTDLLTSRAATRLREAAEGEGQGSSSLSLKLVLADQRRPWLIDFQSGAISRGDAPRDWVVMTDSDTLLEIASGAPECWRGSS